MQEGEDLARFIEEQRAKLAHDRDILKNNPASAITDNSMNRQYLKLDKENRVPKNEDIISALPNGTTLNVPRNAARPPSTPRIFRLGDDYKRKKEMLKEELRADYRNAMADKNLRTTGVRQYETGPIAQRKNSDLGLSLPIRDHLSAKERLRLERNKEYNKFLHHKEEVDKEKRAARSRSVSLSPVRGVPAATPVIKSFPPPNNISGTISNTVVSHVTSKDAATETYEDLLERKRKQEKSYRAGNEGQHSFRGKSHRFEDEDDDGYYSQRKVRFPSKGRRSLRRGQKYYEDDDDFDEDDGPYRMRNSRRGRGRRRRRILSSEDEEDSEEDERPYRRRRDVSVDKKKLTSSFEREATTGSLYNDKEKRESDDLRSKSAPPEQVYTGLPIGNVASANTVQRRKEEYRIQLLQQMEEKKQSKKKQREQDLEFDAANAREPEPKANRRKVNEDSSPPKRHAPGSPPPAVNDRQGKKEKRSSVRYRVESSSSEDEAPRRSRLRPPPARPGYFMPQAQPPMGYYPPQYPSPYDEAYYYYGTRNPLDPPGMMPQPPVMYPGGVSPLMAASQRDNTVSFNEDGRTTEATAKANSRRSFNKNESSIVADDKRDEEKKRIQMQQYQEELKIQIAQKEREKKHARDEQERYDMKIESEARNYNPWGKGGGGAPMKDRKGNLISDLRQMHIENEEMGRDPTKAEEVVRERLPQTNLYRREERPVIDLSPRQGEDDDPDSNAFSPKFGRSNPFESKQSDEQKTQRDQYKDYLQKQIEEKRRIEAEKREKERIEDEKEEKRLEEQRKRIQAELEAEQEKEKNKKEMARLQNEQLRLAAEQRKKEQQQRQLEEEEDTRAQKDAELREKLQARTSSPPVPALRDHDVAYPSSRTPAQPERVRSSRQEGRVVKQPPEPQVSHTPQILTYRADSPGRRNERDKVRSRAESKRVSRELSALRKQLLSEQRRVENQLRTVDMTGQHTKAKTEYLVDLSKARQKPVAVRRPPTVEKDRPSSKALKEFTDYKYRPEDTASIRMFRAEYPETPSDAKALERQQEALLARQGMNLENLRQQKHTDQQSPKNRRKDQHRYRPPPTAQSQTSMLQAETAYIPVLPGDDDDELENRFRIDSNQSSPPASRNSRRPSARERRRMAQKPPSAQSERRVPARARQDNYSLNSLSSLATLDVDRLANKNHDRLEKLRAIQGDDVSLTDPDDILDRFVNKQKAHDPRKGRRPATNEDGIGGRAGPSDVMDLPIQSQGTRPPSVNTVDTEPWLRPETGPTVA